MASAPTTKLDAINSILSVVGETPITSLEYVSDSASARIASNILDEVDRSFQANGWSFNTDIDYTFTRDNVTNQISVPSNAIRISVPEASYPTLKVVQRGTKLYDAKNKTYVFSTNIVGEMVSLLDFDLLPESARNFVIVRAGRLFLTRTRPDEVQAKISEADEQLAFASFVDYEVKLGISSKAGQTNLKKFGVNFAEFLKLSREQQQLMLDGASNLDNIISSISSSVASFEASSNRNKAINQVLRSLNITPVKSLTESDTAYTADKILAESEKIIQSEGWHFNTEKAYTLTKDVNNEILLSQVTLPVLQVDADKYEDYKHNIVVRNGKLYNIAKSTFVFSGDVKAEVVLQHTWDNIPAPIQRYIMARASKELALILGREALLQPLALEEARAKLDATQYNSEQGDYSIFDTYDVARVLDRSIGYSTHS